MRLNRLGGIIGKGSLQCSAMQLVLLGGELGEKYGTKHEYYNLRTPADAIKLLCVNYPEFQHDLVTAHERGVGYKVIKGLPMEGYDEINLPFGSKPLMLVPVITGSGSSTGQILLGVGLVAASFLLPGAGLFGTTSLFGTLAAGSTAAIPYAGAIGVAGGLFGTAVGTALSAVGASLILSGTASLISPQPEIPNLGNNRLQQGTRAQGTGPQGITRGASGEQSYLFTGPANTVGAGAVVPVIYGRVITGSHLIASTLEVVDDSDPHLKQIGVESLDTVTINSEKVSNKFEELGGLLTKRLDNNYVFGSTDDDKRIAVNHEFGDKLQDKVDSNADLLETGGRLEYKQRDAKAFGIVFSLEDGLFSYASSDDTTKYPGTISYRIEVWFTKGSDAVIAAGNATIQGFFNTSRRNPYVYMHRLNVPEIDDSSDEYLYAKVKVTNAECRDNTKFKLIGYGYNLG